MAANRSIRIMGRTQSRKPAPPAIEITNDQVTRPGNSGSTLGSPPPRDEGSVEEQTNKALSLRVARQGLPTRAPDRQPYMFINPGSLCYRNSALAMLLNVEPFLGWLRLYRQVSPRGTGDPPDSCPESIMSYLYKMAEAYWLLGNGDEVLLHEALDERILPAFWADMDYIWEWENPDLQQDASEFLGYLWERAREEINHNHARDVLDAMFSTTKLPRDVTGPSCLHRKVRVRNELPGNTQIGLFFIIYVNDESPRTLRGCIQNALHDEAAADQCIRCKEERMAGHRFHKFRTLPEVLFLSISRTPDGRISHARCEVPATLDLREFRENEDQSRDQDAVYQYAAAVFHRGDDIQSGHYLTHVRNKDGRCFLLDDMVKPRVQHCSMEEMNNKLDLDVTIVAYVKMHKEAADDTLVPDAEERVLTWWRDLTQPVQSDQAVPHQEPPRADSPTAQTSGPKSPNTGASEPGTPISGSPHTGAAKLDTPMPDSPKSGSPNTDTGRSELPRSESPQHDSPGQDKSLQEVSVQDPLPRDPPGQDSLPQTSPLQQHSSRQATPAQATPTQATPTQATPTQDYSNMNRDELKTVMKSFGLLLDKHPQSPGWYVDKVERHTTKKTFYPEYTFPELKKEIGRRGLDPKGIKMKNAAVKVLQNDDRDKGYEGPFASINRGQNQEMPQTKRGTPAEGEKKSGRQATAQPHGSNDTTPAKGGDPNPTPENPDVNPSASQSRSPDHFVISATLQVIGKPSTGRAEPLTHTWSLPANFQPELNVNVIAQLTVIAPDGRKSQYPLPASDRQIFHIPSLADANKKRKDPPGRGDGGNDDDDDDDDDGGDDNPSPRKKPTGQRPPSSDNNDGRAEEPKKPGNLQQTPSNDGANNSKKDALPPSEDSSTDKTPNNARQPSQQTPEHVPLASTAMTTYQHSPVATSTASQHTSASDSELPTVVQRGPYALLTETGTQTPSSGENSNAGSKRTSSDISSTVSYDAYNAHGADYLLDPATGRLYDYLLNPEPAQHLPADTTTGKDSQNRPKTSGSESDISSTVAFDAYNEHLGDYLLDPETGLPFAFLLEAAEPTTRLPMGTDTGTDAGEAATSGDVSKSPPQPHSPPPTPQTPNTNANPFQSKAPRTPKTPSPPCTKQLPTPPHSRAEKENQARVHKHPSASGAFRSGKWGRVGPVVQ